MVSQESLPHTFPIIALITDFGVTDGYTGVMKAVMLSICPGAALVDITHHIRPQNIQQAAYVLMSVYRYLPSHAIVVAVVDPGVGSSRKPVAIQTSHGTYIGPDNGLFSYVLNQVEVRQIVNLQNSRYHLPEASTTFHGRDIFSPVAAYLAKGADIMQMGPPLSRLERLPNPLLEIGMNALRGEVLHIDHFGNLITSIGQLRWDASDILQMKPAFPPVFAEEVTSIQSFAVENCAVELGEHIFETLYLSYSAVAPGKPLALINSAGQLEIAVNQGNAAKELGIQAGDTVYLRIDMRN